MTLKVSTQRLIAAIQKKRADILAAHAVEVREASGKFAEYKRAFAAKLQEHAATIKAAKSMDEVAQVYDRYGSYLRDLPTKPREVSNPNTAKYDEALARLELVEDDVVTMSEKTDASFLALI